MFMVLLHSDEKSMLRTEDTVQLFTKLRNVAVDTFPGTFSDISGGKHLSKNR